MEIASLNLSANAVPSTPLQVSGVETVGFGKRAAARIIDMIIHWGVGLIAGVLAAIVLVIAATVTGGSADEMMARLEKTSAVTIILSLFGAILFESICEGLHGSTPGKRVLGLVVLREDGRPCTYVQAVGRSFAFLIDGLFFGLVAHSVMKDSPRDQRLGDKWCGTIVATRASAPAGSLRSSLHFVGVLFLALFLDGLAMMASMLI